MLDQKIIAQNITNLTDARYFAAWGVDYVSFNTKSDSEFKISKEDIKEIIDWLEGPKVLIENDSLEFDELADGFILDNIYSSLPQSKECFYRTDLDELKKSLPSGKYIIKIKDQEQLTEIRELDPDLINSLDLYLDISDIILKDASSIANFGIAIQGGEEEKAGIKSFEDLDELYDLLLG